MPSRAVGAHRRAAGIWCSDASWVCRSGGARPARWRRPVDAQLREAPGDRSGLVATNVVTCRMTASAERLGRRAAPGQDRRSAGGDSRRPRRGVHAAAADRRRLSAAGVFHHRPRSRREDIRPWPDGERRLLPYAGHSDARGRNLRRCRRPSWMKAIVSESFVKRGVANDTAPAVTQDRQQRRETMEIAASSATSQPDASRLRRGRRDGGECRGVVRLDLGEAGVDALRWFLQLTDHRHQHVACSSRNRAPPRRRRMHGLIEGVGLIAAIDRIQRVVYGDVHHRIHPCFRKSRRRELRRCGKRGPSGADSSR